MRCRYGMSESLDKDTDIMNYAFTSYFTVEVIIRLSGFGITAYFADKMNWCVRFDLAIWINLEEAAPALPPCACISTKASRPHTHTHTHATGTTFWSQSRAW